MAVTSAVSRVLSSSGLAELSEDSLDDAEGDGLDVEVADEDGLGELIAEPGFIAVPEAVI